MSDNEEVSPALTLKERWLREFWEAYARGGKDAANVLLGKLIDDMSTDDLTACFTPKIFRRILAEIIVPKLKRKFQEKAIPLGAVVFIDLDYFKRLNEKFGHAGGDEVLRVFGKKLREMFRVSDVIGRLGGDEFVIIADGLSVAMVEERIDKLKKELFIYPWKLDRIDGGKTSAGHELSFTAKLEEITNPDVLDELIRLADIALMKEKASRGQVEETGLGTSAATNPVWGGAFFYIGNAMLRLQHGNPITGTCRRAHPSGRRPHLGRAFA